MTWVLRACPHCAGDLHDDDYERGWLACTMCSRSWPKGEIVKPVTVPVRVSA